MFTNKTFEFSTKYSTYNIKLARGFYRNGNKAVQFIDADDGSPVLVATVNVGTVNEPDLITIKDYSENEGVLEFMQKIGFVDGIDHYERTGYVNVPVCHLTEEGKKFFE